MADANDATVSQYTPVEGMKLVVSTTASTNLTDDTLVFADLAVTVKQPQYQGAASAKIDVTTIASKAKEYALGLDDSGTFAMSGNWKISDPAQQALLTAKSDKKARVFKTTFSDGSGFVFAGLVDQFTWSADVDNVVTGTFNVQVTGSVLVVQPPAQWGN